MERGDIIATHIARLTLQTGSRVIGKRHLQMSVEGLEHVPRSGPVIIVARHYHHLYDGAALLATLPRPVHILVALDWVQQRWLRRVMERACALARWPVVLRGERLNQQHGAGHSAFAASEARRYLRHAVGDAIGLLRQGKALLIFPEAYPTIDPTYTPKHAADAFLPFRPGFVKLTELAERNGHTQVALVPAGLTYTHHGRWQVTLRFAPPVFLCDYTDHQRLAQHIEACVHTLSNPTSSAEPTFAEEAAQL